MGTAILVEAATSIQPRLYRPLGPLNLCNALASHQCYKRGQTNQDSSENQSIEQSHPASAHCHGWAFASHSAVP